MSTATELLRRALKDLEEGLRPIDKDILIEEIRTFLAVEPEAEPVAWTNETELNSFIGNWGALMWKNPDKGDIPLYRHQLNPQQARKPLPKKIDPILRSARGVKYSPNYVAGWNNCIDAMNDGAEARKPVAWPISGEIAQRIAEKQCVSYEVVQLIAREILYTRPEPARKPMTDKEIDVGFNPYRMRWLADDQYFVAGVRWAEKHHGIGTNKSDPDSIDLQSRCRGDKL